MDDYSALAQRISVGVPGVSGSLVLSRDGLVLGAHPDEVESHAKQAWLRFISLGEPDRSFVEFPDQVWAYVKRGPYAAFAIAEPGVRPGVLVDRLEQVLLSAEDGRSRRDPLRVPDQAAAPSGKPRTSLHPQSETPAPSEIAAIAAEAIRPAPERSSSVGAGSVVAPTPVERPTPDPLPGAAPEAPTEDSQVPPESPARRSRGDSGTGFDDDAEVDRVLLAKEFSGLLQVDSGDDEASP
ncbi:MAG TPA: hypothetical protein VFP41_07210 [Actinomycetota bacterium]|nr:hypothetical protein [Actinomycetota bacterium]